MRSIAEINEKIRSGKGVVLTKDELLARIDEQGYEKTYGEVDVVTTATFGPMCSSGMYFNTGHTKPKMKFGGGEVTLDGVPCYAGFAAVDLFLGATGLPDDDPRNSVYPGSFRFGGAHVIEKLVRGEDVVLEVYTHGTDCYPRKELVTRISLKDMNEAVLFNMRNCYQNYNVAVNTSDKPIYTYMGMLKPGMGNANFCSAGYYSPLLCDPLYRSIGIGTKIFLGGGEGFVSFWGTQHSPGVARTDSDVPTGGAGTLAVIGDMKTMDARFLRATSMTGYGVSLSVGIGIPIPVLDEQVFRHLCVRDEDIPAQVVDYAQDYPNGVSRALASVTYKELRSGAITIDGRQIPSGSLSSLRRAREIAGILKERILNGTFLITAKVADLPGPDSGYGATPLKERPVRERSRK